MLVHVRKFLIVLCESRYSHFPPACLMCHGDFHLSIISLGQGAVPATVGQLPLGPVAAEGSGPGR